MASVVSVDHILRVLLSDCVQLVVQLDRRQSCSFPLVVDEPEHLLPALRKSPRLLARNLHRVLLFRQSELEVGDQGQEVFIVDVDWPVEEGVAIFVVDLENIGPFFSQCDWQSESAVGCENVRSEASLQLEGVKGQGGTLQVNFVPEGTPRQALKDNAATGPHNPRNGTQRQSRVGFVEVALDRHEVEHTRQRELRSPVCSTARRGLGLVDLDEGFFFLIEVAEHARVEFEVVVVVGEEEGVLVFWDGEGLADLEFGERIAAVP